MRIRHSRLTKDFLQVPNATVRDDRMSHMARGILVELLSRPDGWNTACDDMWQASVAKHGKGSPGRRQFRAAFAELKKLGYLQSERELLAGGQHATVLVVQDVSAAQPDVPHGGTSEGSTDVPDAGTSERPAETGIDAAQPDVPPCGTSVPPAETGLSAAHSDVPHGGTSKEENWEKKTGLKNTSSSASPIGSQQADEDHLSAFGAFWTNYPKKIHMVKAKTEWIAAVRRGVDPALMVAKAQSYARAVVGQDPQFTSYPANWLANERYHDEYPETPVGRPGLHVVDGQKHQPFRINPNANYANGF